MPAEDRLRPDRKLEVASSRGVVLQVACHDRRVQAAVEKHLIDGGFPVLHDSRLAQAALLGTVTEALRLTQADRETLAALTEYDTTDEMAAALGSARGRWMTASNVSRRNWRCAPGIASWYELSNSAC